MIGHHASYLSPASIFVYTAGLVLVRQKPGSAKGVMFITIEDESGPANLVVWPTLFEKRRRVVLGSSMMAINGRIQREGRWSILLHINCSTYPAILWGLPIAIKNSSYRQDVAMSLPTVAGLIRAINRSRWRARATCFRLTFISIP